MAHIRVLRESLILHVILNTLLLSNALKNLVQIKVNVKIILMFTRSVRKRRGRLDWNGTRIGPYFHKASSDFAVCIIGGEVRV